MSVEKWGDDRRAICPALRKSAPHCCHNWVVLFVPLLFVAAAVATFLLIFFDRGFVSFYLSSFLAHTYARTLAYTSLLNAVVCASVRLPLSFYWRYCGAFISIAIAKALAQTARNTLYCHSKNNNINSQSEHPQSPQSNGRIALASAFALAFAVAAVAGAAATSSSSRSALQKKSLRTYITTY